MINFEEKEGKEGKSLALISVLAIKLHKQRGSTIIIASMGRQAVAGRLVVTCGPLAGPANQKRSLRNSQDASRAGSLQVLPLFIRGCLSLTTYELALLPCWFHWLDCGFDAVNC